MVRLLVVAEKLRESFTFTVKVKVPGAVGVVLAIVPFAPRAKGFGSDPDARANV
jgi:hypothetical protein